jgi:hypothetical protein
MANNQGWEEENLSFLDVLTILSFIIGIENLSLNQQQVTRLEQHLSKQDTELLSKIINQNELIIEQNELLIKLLKEKNNAQ